MSRESLTPRQRFAIKERDGYRCQGCPGTEICGRKEPENCPDRLQVHHIWPRSFMKAQGFDPDYPENLITVCDTLHTKHPESIHSKRLQGQLTYQGQHRPDAITSRDVYWNNRYDPYLQQQAAQNTQQARREGWEFPFRADQKR